MSARFDEREEQLGGAWWGVESGVEAGMSSSPDIAGHVEDQRNSSLRVAGCCHPASAGPDKRAASAPAGCVRHCLPAGAWIRNRLRIWAPMDATRTAVLVAGKWERPDRKRWIVAHKLRYARGALVAPAEGQAGGGHLGLGGGGGGSHWCGGWEWGGRRRRRYRAGRCYSWAVNGWPGVGVRLAGGGIAAL